MGPPKEYRGDPAAKVNFPLYAVEMLTERHFVVAGGGGAAKTGVYNGFVCFICSIFFSLNTSFYFFMIV